MSQRSLQYLIDQYATGEISPGEMELFKQYIVSGQGSGLTIKDDDIRKWIEQRIAQRIMEAPPPHSKDWDQQVQQILSIDKTAPSAMPISGTAKKIFRLAMPYAAAVLFLVGLTTVFFIYQNRSKQNPVEARANMVTADEIFPGSNKAILTLDDGNIIVLDDSLRQGVITEQGGSLLLKINNGEIVYNAGQEQNNEILWNTMSTPRGGQYKLTLPDGTRVWLNAASSIKYPVAFVGIERRVTVKGEAYIEVAHDKTKPFIVNVDGRMNVKALGTSFNISSYDDEENTTTTLIDGKVQVWKGNETNDLTDPAPGGSMVLSPGQQARLSMRNTNTSIEKKLLNQNSIEGVLAWKNGYFIFDNMNIKEMARQLERWYDVKFLFEGGAADMEIGGKMDRGVKLADIIKFFNDYGFKTELNGRVITVKK